MAQAATTARPTTEIQGPMAHMVVSDLFQVASVVSALATVAMRVVMAASAVAAAAAPTIWGRAAAAVTPAVVARTTRAAATEKAAAAARTTTARTHGQWVARAATRATVVS